MPFYEYECASCKYYLEVMQKISDAPLRKCPSCGRNTLKKLVSAPVFRLKGSGWYETDFKSEKEGQRNLVAAEKNESAASETPKKEDKATASKPAAESKPEAESKPAATRSAPRRKAAAPGPARAKPRRKTAGGRARGRTARR